MNRTVRAPYAEWVAERMANESQSLAQQWLDRLADLLPLHPNAVFPTPELLDHIPLLIEQIAGYLRAPTDLEIAANTSVIEKAQELGQLRHRQRASVHQILREYDILADLLEQFVLDETAKMEASEATPADGLGIMLRLGHAVRTLLQTTVDTFVGEYTLTISQQTAKLESFNRMLMHELRNPLSTLRFAVERLARSEADIDAHAHQRLIALMRANLDRTIAAARGLGRLVFTERTVDVPNQQHVSVGAVATEVARQLADMADTRGVDITVDPELPALVTDPAQLELVLMNLISNAIKYCDPAKNVRYVEVRQGESAAPGMYQIMVQDNGLGIPSDQLDLVFTRFFRGHPDRDQELGVEGSGLGLAIVEESVRVLGGQIRVESQEGIGTAFHISLPASSTAAPPDGGA